MTTSALIVLNPRDIPYCMDALRSLAIPTCWISYMPEPQAAICVNRVIASTSFDRYVVISDDCEPTQDALDFVLALHDEERPVVTGYSNFDGHLPIVNLRPVELTSPAPQMELDDFYLRTTVDDMTQPIPTWFAGLSFTCMTRDLWTRFPLEVTAWGCCMDYVLSWNLQQADIRIFAAPGAFVLHHKDKFGVYPDTSPEKQLLLGKRPPGITWTIGGTNSNVIPPAVERCLQPPYGEPVL